MKLRFAPQAVRDLAAIADHIKSENPAAALRVRETILKSLEVLRRFPRIGRVQTVEQVRKFVTPKYPYLVYYTADEGTQEIAILAIRHPAREREYSDR